MNQSFYPIAEKIGLGLFAILGLIALLVVFLGRKLGNKKSNVIHNFMPFLTGGYELLIEKDRKENADGWIKSTVIPDPRFLEDDEKITEFRVVIPRGREIKNTNYHGKKDVLIWIPDKIDAHISNNVQNSMLGKVIETKIYDEKKLDKYMRHAEDNDETFIQLHDTSLNAGRAVTAEDMKNMAFEINRKDKTSSVEKKPFDIGMPRY